jgi:hypothetical protein
MIAIRADKTMIELRDNGPGLLEDVIADMLDFTVRVSSREACVRPTRGAQDNALKTLLAVPFVLNGSAGASRASLRNSDYQSQACLEKVLEFWIVTSALVTHCRSRVTMG